MSQTSSEPFEGFVSEDWRRAERVSVFTSRMEQRLVAGLESSDESSADEDEPLAFYARRLAYEEGIRINYILYNVPPHIQTTYSLLRLSTCNCRICTLLGTQIYFLYKKKTTLVSTL